MSQIYPFLQKKLKSSLDARVKQGTIHAEGVALPIADTVRVLASRLNSIIFFGETLSSESTFADALLQYPKEMVSCMAAFQITPSFMSSFVHKILTHGGKTQELILNRLVETMGTGFSSWDNKSSLKPLTLLYNMVQMTRDSDYWQGPEHLAQSLLGIWFAAAHQPWMNLDFVIISLCLRPEWQSALRNEIGDPDQLDYEKLQKLPLLDGIIKESMRLHPSDTLAVRRKALNDYQFANGGPFIPSGSTVCVSSYDKTHDPVDYPDPYEYRPARFTDMLSSMKGSRLTDVSDKFPVWGFGSLACPGRFHAALVIKIILAHLIYRFDMKLENEKARTLWKWETFTMPYESTKFVLKERVAGAQVP